MKRVVKLKSIGAAMKRDSAPSTGYARPLLPPGGYDCLVLDARRTFSVTGDEMIKIVLGARDADRKGL